MSDALQQQTYDKTLLGFWIYLMTDCVLFATLFATYVLLQTATYGGAGPKELFDLPYALGETMVLLVSSFTSGLAVLSSRRGSRSGVLFWFAITFALGALFLFMEIREFLAFIEGGHSWESSAFLSAFFTLVGTHGLHISLGLLWMIVLLLPICRRGLNAVSIKRIACLGLFWHFLDVIWIFIFTVVYLMGVI